MAHVEIVESLYKEIIKRFKRNSVNVLQHLKSLENSPKKGKTLGTMGGLVIKELRYKGFRFYFIVDGHKLKIFSREAFTDLLFRFVRMSDKKRQQKTIEEIRQVLLTIGPKGFR